MRVPMLSMLVITLRSACDAVCVLLLLVGGAWAGRRGSARWGPLQAVRFFLGGSLLLGVQQYMARVVDEHT